MEKQIRLILLITAPILLLVIGVLLAMSVRKPATQSTNLKTEEVAATPTTEPTQAGSQNSKVAPTLSAERAKILSKVKTYTVTIEKGGFSPIDLKIKRYDQVQWVNKDTSPYQVKGADWGNVPIAPGESYLQAFQDTGTFPYSDAFHPDAKGTITVE